MTSVSPDPVHPRACGERRQTSGWTRLQTRFIPAPAGNASTGRRSISRATVHPRACGERGRGQPDTSTHTGSSPRLRGTLSVFKRCMCLLRFIPAPAGNACRPCISTPSVAVHPRACGERASMITAFGTPRGSSPRLRGTPEGRVDGLVAVRFIPAPAGNALSAASPPTGLAVHPRACGERPISWVTSSRPDGSSPRLRGTLTGGDGFSRHGRFIPAPAGNATRVRSSRAKGAVHPRACGER